MIQLFDTKEGLFNKNTTCDKKPKLYCLCCLTEQELMCILNYLKTITKLQTPSAMLVSSNAS